MKTNSLKHVILASMAISCGRSLDEYIHYNPRCLHYNPGSEARYSKGNSGVRKAQRAAKKRQNIRARSKH